MQRITTKSFKPPSSGAAKKKKDDTIFTSGQVAWFIFDDKVTKCEITASVRGGFTIRFNETDLLGVTQTRLTDIKVSDIYVTLAEADAAILLKRTIEEAAKKPIDPPITDPSTIMGDPIVIPEPVKTDPTSPFGARKKGTTKKPDPSQTLKTYRTLGKFKKIKDKPALYKILCKLATDEKLPNIFPAMMVRNEYTVEQAIAIVEGTEDLTSLINPKLDKQIAEVELKYRYDSHYDNTFIYLTAEAMISLELAMKCMEDPSPNVKHELDLTNYMTPIKRLSTKYWSNRKDKILKKLNIQDNFLEYFTKGQAYTQTKVSDTLRVAVMETMRKDRMLHLPKSLKARLPIGGPDGTA